MCENEHKEAHILLWWIIYKVCASLYYTFYCIQSNFLLFNNIISDIFFCILLMLLYKIWQNWLWYISSGIVINSPTKTETALWQSWYNISQLPEVSWEDTQSPCVMKRLDFNILNILIWSLHYKHFQMPHLAFYFFWPFLFFWYSFNSLDLAAIFLDS